MFRVCHVILSIHYSLVVASWERANLLALLYMMFSCVYVTFPCRVLGQVWYLIVLIPDLCFVMVNGDPQDGLFYSTLTLMIDSNNLYPCHWHITKTCFFMTISTL